MMEWWQTRAERERALIIGAGALLCILLVVQFLILPTLRTNAEARADNANAARTYGVVSSRLSALPDARHSQTTLSGDAYRSHIVDAARQLGLSVARIQTSGEGTISIVFESVAPQAVFAMLNSLERDHAIVPSRAIISQDTEQTVRASLEFEGGTP